MADHDQIYRVKAEVAELAGKIKEAHSYVNIGRLGQVHDGELRHRGQVLQLCGTIARECLIFLILSSLSANSSSDLVSDLEKLTLGEVVRLIKAQQHKCEIFQQAEKRAVGQLFSLLDRIVALLEQAHSPQDIRGFGRSENRPACLARLNQSALQFSVALTSCWAYRKINSSFAAPQSPTVACQATGATCRGRRTPSPSGRQCPAKFASTICVVLESAPVSRPPPGRRAQ